MQWSLPDLFKAEGAGEEVSFLFSQAEAIPEVLVLGDGLLDYQFWVAAMPARGVEEEILRARKSLGGSGCNTALGFSFLAQPTAFCGRLGKDENGEKIKRELKGTGLDLKCLQYGESTGYTVTVLDG